MTNSDLALQAPSINSDPGPEYASSTRLFQGIPGIERDPASGRLWATWYCNGKEAREGPENYVVLVASEDDGATWSEPLVVVDPPGLVRAFDPCIWYDPRGRLWLHWAQSYEHWDGRAGVWFSRNDDPNSETSAWTTPRRIANGIMMNKPTVASDGSWLLPTAVWAVHEPFHPELAGDRFSNIVASHDDGQTFERIGGADVPTRGFDEHMTVELRDGRLWMLVRRRPGVGESYSEDGGRTWTLGKRTALRGPDSRFFIRRLRSGSLLFVSNDSFDTRHKMTAWISGDDGATWSDGLLLDARMAVSYPDGIEDETGLIRIIYDRERVDAREILVAQFHEEDVRAGKIVTSDGQLRRLVSRVSQD